jgi:DNA-binding PadR family transcriptional regulator
MDITTVDIIQTMTKKAQRNLDLTPAMTHILLVLAGGERHGYGIMMDISRITEGKMRVGPGTLYRSISQMLNSGLIEESHESVDPALDDERRKYYRLTDYGRQVIQAEIMQLEKLLTEARSRGLLNGRQRTATTGGEL